MSSQTFADTGLNKIHGIIFTKFGVDLSKEGSF